MNKIRKNDVLNWVYNRYKSSKFDFEAIPYNNKNTKYWFKNYREGITVFPGLIFCTRSIWIETQAGEKQYEVFRYGTLRKIFDDLEHLENAKKQENFEKFKKQINISGVNL